MRRAQFFAAIRPAFGGKLSEDQVTGISALLDAGADLPLHHMANVLAQVRRETGGGMAPIKETVMPWHKDRHPSDKDVIGRLDRAYAAGKLPWVKAAYWRDGYFGRGQIQLTHRANYAKFGIVDPQDALRYDVSARVAVQGMRDGMFTGKRLADYRFPAALDNPPGTNPRRIVNGPDGSDMEVATFHRQFVAALDKAGWGVAAQPVASTPVVASPAPQTVTKEPRVSGVPQVNETPESEHVRPDVSTPPQFGLAGVLRAIWAALAVLFSGKGASK